MKMIWHNNVFIRNNAVKGTERFQKCLFDHLPDRIQIHSGRHKVCPYDFTKQSQSIFGAYGNEIRAVLTVIVIFQPYVLTFRQCQDATSALTIFATFMSNTR